MAGSTNHLGSLGRGKSLGHLETYNVFLSLLPCKFLTVLAPLGSPGREGMIALPTGFTGLAATIHVVKGSGEFGEGFPSETLGFVSSSVMLMLTTMEEAQRSALQGFRICSAL